ncbi:hypothetical protein [Crocinitomix catalasitica]|uniref:hypothetical protein n=1 Tax=Crocinitomix catalasitica TaxID=184607 RepID=UPI000483E6D0|nr:hypothetical protein [Crocinitomix catalasitica]
MTEEIEKMLAHTVEYATDLLNETGEAYPFGAFLDTIDNVHPLEMEIDTKNVPTIGKVIEALTKYCTSEMEEEKMNAYALAYEVQIQTEQDAEPIDAIAIDMIQKSTEILPLFYLPFTVDANKKATIGELFGVKR